MKELKFMNSVLIKHKYIILFILVIIIFGLFYVLNNYERVIEGFADNIGKFKYLAPDASGNTWDPDTVNKFVDKYNSVNNLTGDKALKPDSFTKKDPLVQNALQEEAEYYIKTVIFLIVLI
jgi:hypothetical protein